jgi:hypothetical protein
MLASRARDESELQGHARPSAHGFSNERRQARSELDSFLKEQPENYDLIGDLALTNVGLGDKEAALALSERGIVVLPIERDVVTGAAPIETLARVAAQTGEHDRATGALQQVLSIPGTAHSINTSGRIRPYVPLCLMRRKRSLPG